MRAPVRPLKGGFPRAIEDRWGRFFWTDPRVVEDRHCSAEEFRTAMAAFHVGKTIKITGVGRHHNADALLTGHVDTRGAVVLDIGASDGSTSLELLAKLPDVARFIICDLYFHLDSYRWRGRTYYFGPDDRVVLVAGKRWIAWPTQSRTVEFGVRRGAARARRRGSRTDVLLLNPDARRAVRDDDRVAMAVHDIFRPWPGELPDVIKVANLLRRLYFDDTEIAAALDALFVSLPENGHLLVVDNPRIAGIAERAGLYRRGPVTFEPVAVTPHLPEIDDLVRSARRPARRSS